MAFENLVGVAFSSALSSSVLVFEDIVLRCCILSFELLVNRFWKTRICLELLSKSWVRCSEIKTRSDMKIYAFAELGVIVNRTFYSLLDLDQDRATIPKSSMV